MRSVFHTVVSFLSPQISDVFLDWGKKETSEEKVCRKTRKVPKELE